MEFEFVVAEVYRPVGNLITLLEVVSPKYSSWHSDTERLQLRSL